MAYINKMKKTFRHLLAVLCLLCLTFVSCGERTLYSDGDGELKVLCTTFAPFDFARIVGGERVTVTLLQDTGSDMHSYTPTGATLEALSAADAFIYIGGVSDDAWVDDAILAAGNDQLASLRLIDEVEEVVAELEEDWSEHEHHEADDHDHEHEDHDDHEHGADEHIWVSPRNAILCVEAICELFCKLDPDGAGIYQANAEAYVEQLLKLNAEYEAVAELLCQRTMVFADRFPFVYLMHDYKIPYVAAFSGCSTEVNASFEMQVGLIRRVRDENLAFVVVTEGGDKTQAEAIASETGCRIVALDSLQAVKRSDVQEGLTYLDAMAKNLAILKEAASWN